MIFLPLSFSFSLFLIILKYAFSLYISISQLLHIEAEGRVMDSLKVSNVVICVKLQELSNHPEKLLQRVIDSKDQVKLYHNFSVIKAEAYKYIAFYRSGHVNIIGNQNFEQIPQSIKVFLKFFNL